MWQRTERKGNGMSGNDNVAVLMGTLNGEKYIRRQLDSIFMQTHSCIEVWVSDDGSGDGTLGILDEYARQGKHVYVVQGPGLGFSRNFLALARNESIKADWFAWADDDDIWMPEKIATAIARLRAVPASRPAIFASRTILVDADRKKLGLSRIPAAPSEFRRMLAQNPVSGNTMVFNRAARDLLMIGDVPDVFAHDWWLGILVLGNGGVLEYETAPLVEYVQHAGNRIGASRTVRQKLRKFIRSFLGSLQERNARHIRALESRRDMLSDGNREIVDAFAEAHDSRSLFERINVLMRFGIRRDSLLENIALLLLCVLRRYP